MACVTALIVLSVILLPLSSAELEYVKLSPPSCNVRQVCYYNYSVEIGHLDKPLTVDASIQVQCVSSGHYGDIPATEHCLKITDIGGNFLNFKDNKTKEFQEYKWKLRSFTLEQLSGEFCYVQTTGGRVELVYHHQDEEESVINFKKGIAAAFQTNFNGAADEIETDTQSIHHSHYSYSDESFETRRMHRTITSDDIIEYSNGVDTNDVHFSEEDDMEYKDGRLIKAGGTIDISLKREKQTASRVFSAVHGKFSMVLVECINASSSRNRRSNKPPLREEQTIQTNLMGTYDTSKSDIEVLQSLRQQFETPEKIIETIRDTENQQ